MFQVGPGDLEAVRDRWKNLRCIVETGLASGRRAMDAPALPFGKTAAVGPSSFISLRSYHLTIDLLSATLALGNPRLTAPRALIIGLEINQGGALWSVVEVC
jgi:hypothetical protein